MSDDLAKRLVDAVGTAEMEARVDATLTNKGKPFAQGRIIRAGVHASAIAALRELAASFDEHEAKWSEKFKEDVGKPSHYVEGYLDAIADQATGLRALADEIASAAE